MATKRKILEALTRSTLLDLAKSHDVGGLTNASKGEIVEALAGNRRVQLETFLGEISRDDLKKLCEDLGLETTGREKQVLVDRVLGREPANDEKPAVPDPTDQPVPKRSTQKSLDLGIEDYRHSKAKRKNNPPAKIAAEGTVPAMPKIEYSYSPRRPPVLRFDTSGKADKLPELLEKATKGPLTKEEAQILAEALRTQQPWLEWAGKRETESKGFSVDPVALHIHERISSQAILKVAARQDVERTLFSDPEQEYHEAVQFYKHDVQWTNRLILGDSAHVMGSLAHREDLAGKVQMIYMDPPYGIRYGSNFQPEIGKRSVGDADADFTRELEMVQAYRDTWHLGVHSYLVYLRERLVIAKKLLADTGSVFVQIGDENAHRVRVLLEEVFGPSNHVSTIVYKTAIGMAGGLLDGVYDQVIWFAKEKEQLHYRQLFSTLEVGGEGATRYKQVHSLVTGETRLMTEEERDSPESLPGEWQPYRDQGLTSRSGSATTTIPFEFNGTTFRPSSGGWRTNQTGLTRVSKAERLMITGATVNYKKFFHDSPALGLTNFWSDTGGGITSRSDPKVYVVQTTNRIIERCMLMATEPGDLVLDPTCGSGTTAYVAEEWGRRWITIDTSRVAVAIARQRLLTARFEYFELSDDQRGLNAGFKYKTVPHITLKSIAQNQNLDPIFDKHEQVLEDCLKSCNEGLSKVTQEIRHRLDTKLVQKQRNQGKRSISVADNRRWQLPKKGEKFKHWTVPFDTDSDWPKELQQAVTEYRKAWRTKMDEVNACIAANATQEELVDQPEVVKGIVRVSGPFTVEAVQPPERSLGAMEGMFDGAPEELDDTFDTKNVESYLDQMTRLLKLDGVRFPNNKEMAFSRLDRLTAQAGGLHAEGRWLPKGETDDDPEGKATVAVGFGPQYGPVTAKQVEDLIRSASRRGYDALVVAGFSFDGPAQATIEDAQHPQLRIHMASIRPDVNPGMAGLLKDQPGSQLFTVFGQPRTRVEGPNKRSEFVVHMEGVDIYDPVANTIRSTEDSKVAAWFVDGDYDGRTFCITQAFFPDKTAWDKLANALKGVISEEAFEKMSGTVSLPFPLGKHKCVAVKVIDPRGNEVMQVHRLG
jgi:adenine-specific DNA-methyltransferase